MMDAVGMIVSANRSGARSLYASSAVETANSQGVEDMAENVAAEVKQPTQAEIEALIAKAREAGFAEANAIADLCAIAGVPEKASQFIGEKKTADQVRKDLLAARVAAQVNSEVNSSVMPGADATVPVAGKASAWGDVWKRLGCFKGGK
jgi:hypothetical protein